ncbi:hypothetical protein MMC08_004635 [Hypocenomyce scalaris]|nr:hypothetical protein [Hypocenomyce scalaris]
MADNHEHLSIESTRSPAATSTLLQDLLREKKAQSHRVNKTYNVDSREPRRRFSEFDTREVQSSPLAPSNGPKAQAKHNSRASGMGTRNSSGTKEMGAREMDEYVSKINKQNFDLKLELFQRRQRAETLEAKLEKLETLETENRELQDINEELLRELEKRDQAVHEAVGIICDLEDKSERLELAMVDTRPPTAMPDTEQSTDVCNPPSSPPLQSLTIAPNTQALANRSTLALRPGITPTPRLVDVATPSPSKAPRRAPSFLRENKGSTSALRSLYLSDEYMSKGAFSFISLPRPGSLFSREEDANNLDPDNYTLNSPRLSVLSESSFLSVYGDAKHTEAGQQDEGNTGNEEHRGSFEEERVPPFDHRKQRSARITNWIDEKGTPSKPGRTSSAVGKKYTSIDEVVETQRRSLEDVVSRDTLQRELSDYISRKQRREEERKSLSLDGPICDQDILPPTPDTMTPVNTEGRNGSTHSIIAQKSILEGTPTPARTFSALVPPERSRTTEGHVRQVSSTGSQVSDNGNDPRLLDSDNEKESTRAEQSEYGEDAGHEYFPGTSTFMGGSGNQMRVSGGKAFTRPLKIYGTDMMFNGEDLQENALPRTTSYPSPSSNTRRQSIQYPPSERRPSKLSRTETAPTQVSPKDWHSAGSATAIPTRRAHFEVSQTVSPPCDNYHTPSPSHHYLDLTTLNTNSYLPRPSSVQLGATRISPTPNPVPRQTIVSRLFRRSSSHTAPSIPDNSSSGQPSTHTSSLTERTRLTRPRPSSTYIDPSSSPSGYRDYNNTTTSSKIARPGTAGSLDHPRRDVPPHDGRPRPIYSFNDNNTSSSGERINTPGTEQSTSPLDPK